MSDFSNVKIDSFTTPCPITVMENTPLDELVRLMDEENVRHIPVEDGNGNLVGMISQRDVNALKSFQFHQPLYAGDVMVDNPVTVYSGTLLSDAVFKMSDEKIGSVLVMDKEGKLDGIFTSTDALNALVEVLRGEIFS